jgi:hypothetical protein
MRAAQPQVVALMVWMLIWYHYVYSEVRIGRSKHVKLLFALG